METGGEKNQRQEASANESPASGTSARPSTMNSMSLYERQAVQEKQVTGYLLFSPTTTAIGSLQFGSKTGVINPPEQEALHVPGQHPGGDRRLAHGLLHRLLLLRDGDRRPPGHRPLLRPLHGTNPHVRGRGLAHPAQGGLRHLAPAGRGGGHPDRPDLWSGVSAGLGQAVAPAAGPHRGPRRAAVRPAALLP
ncbi:uncharacterized protein LOC129172825 isoform X2 [Dunckerocampus dactyliophorus]|nr:uncharacterized protein LOC129172825 isoform X2 [Dunckerocampus dactyliophorus]XP_054618880.1 uncharacterized protein LOC129172825 isoform X2 [Dunckerocampus dactyliophorus]